MSGSSAAATCRSSRSRSSSSTTTSANQHRRRCQNSSRPETPTPSPTSAGYTTNADLTAQRSPSPEASEKPLISAPAGAKHLPHATRRTHHRTSAIEPPCYTSRPPLRSRRPMKPSTVSRLRKRKALETAATEFRDAQGTDRNEILAARRALWRAERSYDRALTRAERDLATARAPSPIAAYGRRLILYDDRLSTPTRTHELVPSVRARVAESPGHRSPHLIVEGPDWREQVRGHRRDDQALRKLAQAIEQAAREVDAIAAARKPGTEAAEGRLAAARVERLGIEEARPLLDRIAALTESGERVLDMAPGISTGHDGVVVVTDRRLLFVGLRHTLHLPYAAIQDVSIHGRRLGTRLIVSTLSGRS